MSKFTDEDFEFFENINWTQEINSFPVNTRDWIDTGEIVKYLLLSHKYKLTTDNIEMAKMQLLKFILKNIATIDLSDFDVSENTTKRLLPTPEEKKLCIIYQNRYIVSIRFKPSWFKS